MQVNKSVGIVVAQFNTEITEALLQGALDFFEKISPSTNLTIKKVPGAVEVPLALQRLARSQKYDGLIAIAAVIYGETDHYHYVCEQVTQGCLRVMLDESLPVGFGVLTTQNMALAKDRAGGSKGNAGYEAAAATCEMMSL